MGVMVEGAPSSKALGAPGSGCSAWGSGSVLKKSVLGCLCCKAMRVGRVSVTPDKVEAWGPVWGLVGG